MVIMVITVIMVFVQFLGGGGFVGLLVFKYWYSDF